MLRVTCPSCGARVREPDFVGGQTGVCGGCGASLEIARKLKPGEVDLFPDVWPLAPEEPRKEPGQQQASSTRAVAAPQSVPQSPAKQGFYIDPEIQGFCRSIMDGDLGAIAPLADRMEALGNWKAPVIRTRIRLNREDKFAICLTALVGRVCADLACRFVGRILPAWEQARPDDKVARQLIEMRRKWTDWEATDSQLISLVSNAGAFYKQHVKPFLGLKRETPGRQECSAALGVTTAYGLQMYDAGPTCELNYFGMFTESAANSAVFALDKASRKAERTWQLEQLLEVLFG